MKVSKVKFFSTIAIIFAIFVSFFFAVDVQDESDIYNYNQLWSLDVNSLLSESRIYQIGFYGLIYLIRDFVNFDFFYYLNACFLFISFYLFVSGGKVKFGIFVFCFLFFVFYPPLESLYSLVLRQGLSTVLMFYVLYRYDLINSKSLIFYFILLFGLLIHYSFLIFIISLFFVRYIKFSKILVLWFMVVFLYVLNFSGNVGLFLVDFFGLSINSFSESASYLSDGEYYQVGFKINFFILSIIPLLSLVIPHMWKNSYLHLYFSINLFSLFFVFFPYHDRFFIWSWILIPKIFYDSLIVTNFFLKRRF